MMTSKLSKWTTLKKIRSNDFNVDKYHTGYDIDDNRFILSYINGYNVDQNYNKAISMQL